MVGSGFFKAPEMERQEPNGSKADVWSYGISLGVMVGFLPIYQKEFPEGYKGGLGKFFIDCVSDKHDELLDKEGIFISMIFKDLMKKCLTVSQDRRITMK